MNLGLICQTQIIANVRLDCSGSDMTYIVDIYYIRHIAARAIESHVRNYLCLTYNSQVCDVSYIF